MTRAEALAALGESTAEAVVGALQALVPGSAEPWSVAVVPHGTSPLASLPLPAVAARVDYVDGVTGSTVLVVTHAGARKLAAALTGAGQGDGELSEPELYAVTDALSRLLAAAAAATGSTLGTDVQISTPATTLLTTEQESAALFEDGTHRIAASLTVLGEPCRLVQLIPNALVVRLTRALADAASAAVAAGDGHSDAVDADSLRSVPVRVWAELGRTRLPIGRAVGLAPGTVVELDRCADDPVDLYVSGRHFGRGSLVVADGEWAVEVLEILTPDLDLDDLETVA